MGFKVHLSHLVFNSSTDITDIFMAMISDSAIAQKMKFGPNKLSCLIYFGTTSYFKQHLLVDLKETQCFVILFDESLNNEFHKDFNKDRVVCRYLTSRFLGHTCAEDVKKEFEESIHELDMKKMVQVSMDGPKLIGNCMMAQQ